MATKYGQQIRFPTEFNTVLNSVLDTVQPGNRKIATPQESLDSLIGKGFPDNFIETQSDFFKETASLDPRGKIYVGPPIFGEYESERPDGRIRNVVAPSIRNVNYNIVHKILTDSPERTSRLVYESKYYPAWQDQISHPVRSGEGFQEFGVPYITIAPYDQFVMQFSPHIEIPMKDLGQDMREGTLHIVGVVFKDVVNHTVIGRSGVNPDGFKILPPETSQYQVQAPIGTDPMFDGYSTIRNDSIDLGYLHWFGFIDFNKDSTPTTPDRYQSIDKGTFFDINTGAAWMPLSYLNKSSFTEIYTSDGKGSGFSTTEAVLDYWRNLTSEKKEINPLLEALDIPRNMAELYLIPVGSGIAGVDIPSEWNAERELGPLETLLMTHTDIFMHTMDYITGSRMPWEDVQMPRSQRRQLQREGKSIPAPWKRRQIRPPSGRKVSGPVSQGGTGTSLKYAHTRKSHWSHRWYGRRYPHGKCDRLLEMPVGTFNCDPNKGPGMKMPCPNHPYGEGLRRVEIAKTIIGEGLPFSPTIEVVSEKGG